MRHQVVSCCILISSCNKDLHGAKVWRQPLQPSPNREEKAQKFAPSYYGDATAQSLDIGLWHGGVNSNSFRVVELVYLMTQRQ